MKHFFCLLVIVVSNIFQTQAETFKLSGTVKTGNNIPLELANVTLRNDVSDKILGAPTNQEGEFEFQVPSGQYTLTINYLGYETYTSKIQLDTNIDIGILHLNTDARLLEEVIVYAPPKLFERKTDRLVFNVENSIISTGGDVMDVLRVIPGLRVQGDQISLIAKDNMIVTVDDRVIPLDGESLTNYLKSFQVENIQRIEIITNPSAKYDAEGNSGIVNIILKKTFNDSWSLNLRGTYKQGAYPDGNAGTDFNYKKDRLSIFTNISANSGKGIYHMKNLIYYPTETWVLTAPLRSAYRNFNTNIRLDYKLTNVWKIGTLYSGNWSRYPAKDDNIHTTVYDPNSLVKETMSSLRLNHGDNNLNALNLNSIITLDTLGKKILVDFDYFIRNGFGSGDNSGSRYKPDLSLIPDSYYAHENQNKGIVKNYSAKMDIELPLRWINLNTGGKISFSENKNDFIFYNKTTGDLIVDESQTNVFRYRENIQAAYLSAHKQISKTIQFQAGLRVENTVTEGYSKTLNQTDKNSYLKFFPTCYFLYKIKDNRSISLNYSRRIGRPSFGSLNPYKSYFNAYDYNEGNPFLQPSFSNNLEISLTTSNLEHKLWYSYTSGDIFEFPFIDSETQMVRHFPLNCINYYSIGVSESYNFNKFWWWNSFNSAACYYIEKKGTIDEAISSIHTISANMSTNNDFMLNKKRTLMLTLGFYYEFPFLSALGKTDARCYLYSGIRSHLFNENLTLSLTANDIFKSNHSKLTLKSNGIKYVYDNIPDSRYVRLSISYKIGNKKIQSEQRNIGNKEERGRSQ